MAVTINGSTGIGHTDDVKNKYGTGDDLEIYHDGTDSYIKDALGNQLKMAIAGADKGSSLTLNGTNGSSELQSLVIDSDGENGRADFKFNIGGGTPDLNMRFTSTTTQFSGYVLVDRTAAVHGGRLSLDYVSGTTAGMAIKDTQTSGTGVPMQIVNGSGTIVGSITQNQSNAAFNTSSDYRLKENVVAISDGITRIKTLKPSRFNWISDPSDTAIDGFLAHEVTAVPEAVQGEKDAIATEDNEKGKKGDPIYQQIDQSKLVPLLTAALQEAITKIETLETKVAALEAHTHE